jgi:hypothetical protein
MKMKVFGRTVPAVAIALVAMAALASAGLLSYYGMITGTATVTQSLVISSDGSTWKECTGGDYNQCKLTYSLGEIVAGNTQDLNQKFYLKNNLPVAGTEEYVYFKEEFIIPTNLFDGMTTWEVHYTTYRETEKDCDKTTDNLMNFILPMLAGSADRCSVTPGCSQSVGDKTITVFNDTTLNQIVITTTDKLGEGFTQKFCGTTIGLKPNTIPDTYTITIGIVPV